MMKANEARELVKAYHTAQEAKKFAEADEYIRIAVAPEVEREAKRGEVKAIFDPPHRIKAIVAKKLEELGYQVIIREHHLAVAW